MNSRKSKSFKQIFDVLKDMQISNDSILKQWAVKVYGYSSQYYGARHLFPFIFHLIVLFPLGRLFFAAIFLHQ